METKISKITDKLAENYSSSNLKFEVPNDENNKTQVAKNIEGNKRCTKGSQIK